MARAGGTRDVKKAAMTRIAQHLKVMEQDMSAIPEGTFLYLALAVNSSQKALKGILADMMQHEDLDEDEESGEAERGTPIENESKDTISH